MQRSIAHSVNYFALSTIFLCIKYMFRLLLLSKYSDIYFSPGQKRHYEHISFTRLSGGMDQSNNSVCRGAVGGGVESEGYFLVILPYKRVYKGGKWVGPLTPLLLSIRTRDDVSTQKQI